ncbi:sigma-70 family RNA polymerase sigma factor [Kitasatospora sp. NPDC058170]|uniref:sigma-70 family RNA polymerase sigma factor n=1 Tax=Kitasatospora sp. NPDC058170 TaxID=3346364 RepID=UPI0036D8AE40
MAADENAYRNPEALTEEQAGRMLADMNEVIRAGEEMRALRAEMIKVLAGLGWTQDKIAQLTGMSQPAVSKQVAKYRDDPPAPMALALDQRDTPWLEGRLWGLAEEIAETLGAAARCTRHVQAFARGRTRFTPRSVDELRRLVEEDLRAHRAELPAAYRHTYDAVARGLDLPAHGAPAPAEPASVRRALAHRVQRDRLRDAS